ncbi:LysR substrate-binding domain-containing protein [Achromobacter insolitus]|uniref:LysR family transcriptional regulator n=1 Tax=Achromobacter TaxID=222 RepID=UPI0007C64573|nr:MULTISPECIES: LysR family transcriptional regulator [Achromobacter]GLK95893.1 LysR family transcriptional regulator [Achromobacter xylosoxidans]AXA74462.1 LysR family transcriptional regulator [Achromobacter insolitus]MCP1401092.1 DNA-binding transcriptional LysR family regulator [Achromobacter insolitus]MDH3062421.1 LysR substrate-binding domain-containing protein [Achromobacter insolitus]MEB3095502.1 LysR substrate-binding domain-containing protein [Achromobacter sp. D10]
MDFRQLRQFVVLATELNYRKAAARLHMTQPPLSVAIKRLETEIGADLFERDRLGVRLTVAGGAFLREAKRLLEGADAALQAARDAAEGRMGALRVCAVPSAALHLLPRMLPEFTQRFPHIRLRLSSGSTVSILAGLQRGELDAAFLVPPASGVPGIAITALRRERLVLAVPAGHRVAGMKQVRLSDLTDETLVTLAHSDSPGFAGEIVAACQRAGFHPRVLQESSHALISLPLIAAGLGIAIVPAALRRIAIDNVAYVDLADESDLPLTYAMALAAPAESMNPAVRWFNDLARELLGPQTA